MLYFISLNSNHPDIVKSGNKKVTVKCVDIGRILAEYDENDFIIVKMDIEGSEYELLLDLAQKNVLKLIDQLAIEHHENVMEFKTPLDVFNFILKKNEIELLNWI